MISKNMFCVREIAFLVLWRTVSVKGCRYNLSRFDLNKGEIRMNNLLRGGLAGAAAWKFGGGLISSILIFMLVFFLLGYC